MSTYQLINQKDEKDFTLAVNNFIKDGWEIAGDTFTYSEPSEGNTVHFCVPVIKD